MPRYRVLEKSLIGNSIVEEGVEVDYDGLPSANLHPLDNEGRAKAEEAKQVAATNQARMIAETGAADPTTTARLNVAIESLVDSLGAGKKHKV